MKYFNYKYAFLAYFIWPLITVIAVFNDTRSRLFQVIIMCFSALVGYTFYFNVQGSDSMVYADQFNFWQSQNISDLINLVSKLYVSDSSIIDIGLPLIYYSVSRISADIGVFFMVLALLFSFVLLRILKLLQSQFSEFKFFQLLLVTLFFVLVPLFYINHFRWYFSLLLFIYGILIFYVNGKFYSWFILAVSVLMHFSFIAPFLVFTLYRIIKNRNWIYYLILITSFIFSLNLASNLQASDLVENSAYNSKISAYTAEKYMNDVEEGMNSKILILQLIDPITKFSLFLLTILLFMFKKNSSDVANGFYSFSLLVMAMVNFGSQIQSFGTRFSVMYSLLALLALLFGTRHLTLSSLFMKVLILFCISLLFLNLIVKIRYGLEYLGPGSIMPLLPFSLFADFDTNLFNYFE